MSEKPFEIAVSSTREAHEVAAEQFLADVQFALQASLKTAGITRTELARRLGQSEAAINRYLDESGHLTIRTLGRILAAIGDVPIFSTGRFEAVLSNRPNLKPGKPASGNPRVT